MMPRILPDYLPSDWPDYAEIPTNAEWARAQEEDRVLAEALIRLEAHSPSKQSTPKSIAEGRDAIAKGHVRAAELIARRIYSKELLNMDEFCEAVGENRGWVSDAMMQGGLFVTYGPQGRSYFPSFYADPSIRRADVEQVTRVLSQFDASSKYWFFVTVRSSLQATPLHALRAGRFEDVITAAKSYADGF